MRASGPSRTAHFVTHGRALADAGFSHVPNFSDPTARVFLSEKGKRSLAKTERAAKEGKRSMSVEMARGMADLIALRTATIDKAVREAIANGATQLVILGAGYDGRAWRMPELSGIRVFEVDHPATQGEKRAHLSELPPAIGTVTFVPIDFEKESLNSVLDRSGHNRLSPTCWIWEGVVMYLTRDAMRATLADVAKRSASGSTLIVNYHMQHRRLLAQVVFKFIGEPHLSAWTPEEMAADLKAARFSVVDDSSMLDWNNRFAEGKAKSAGRGHYMRIAVARN